MVSIMASLAAARYLNYSKRNLFQKKEPRGGDGGAVSDTWATRESVGGTS